MRRTPIEKAKRAWDTAMEIHIALANALTTTLESVVPERREHLHKLLDRAIDRMIENRKRAKAEWPAVDNQGTPCGSMPIPRGFAKMFK